MHRDTSSVLCPGSPALLATGKNHRAHRPWRRLDGKALGLARDHSKGGLWLGHDSWGWEPCVWGGIAELLGHVCACPCHVTRSLSVRGVHSGR